MSAGRCWRGFLLSAVALAALLFFFSVPYLLWMLAVLLGLAVVLAVLLRLDARHVRAEVKAASGGQVGRPLAVHLTVDRPGHFLAAKHAVVDLEIASVLLGESQTQRILLPLRSLANGFTTTVSVPLCGETVFRCKNVWISDPLELFRVKCAASPESRAVLYPRPVELELTLSRETVGAASAEGLMQNRRGSDPSEIFDLREYAPGDDIRAIHWKLSCKTDSLILRQPSDPSHYDVVLLPDLGKCQGGVPVTPAEINAAAALTASLGGQLLRQGAPFCLAIPSKQGLHLVEVRSRRDLEQALPQWLGVELQPDSGVGLQFFLSDRLEQYFTRLLIVSAGVYNHDLGSLGKRIGVTVVSAADSVSAPTYTALGPACEAAALPTKENQGESYRVIC